MDYAIESEEMHYEGNCIRPPSEAFSILLQVTVGCSHNKCTFCGTYTGKRFRIKDDSMILGSKNTSPGGEGEGPMLMQKASR